MRSSHKDRILRGASLCIGFTAPVQPALAALVHPCTSPLNGESLLPRIQLFFNIRFASMARYFFFACPKNEVPKVALVHPCTRDIRASCTSKKDTPDIKAPNKILGLPSSISSANGYAPT